MDLWSECMDDVTKLDTPALTIDQQLELVKIKATLSVAQELSRLADRTRGSTRLTRGHAEGRPATLHRGRCAAGPGGSGWLGQPTGSGW